MRKIKTNRLIMRSLFIKICTIFLISLLVSFIYLVTNALGQQEALIKKLQTLQQKMATCGSDVSCLQRVAKEMEALAQQINQSESGGMGTGLKTTQGEPCAKFHQPGAEFLGMSCLPVTVKVSDFIIYENYELIYSGVLPDPGKKYTTQFIVFSYEAEAKGELTYKNGFSEFQLMAFGTPAKTRIRKLFGYSQFRDSKNKIRRRDYHFGQPTIRRPFQFSIVFPVQTAKLTNIHLRPVEVNTKDDWMPTIAGSQVFENSYGLTKQFIVTPREMKQFVKAGGFRETFQWRYPQPNVKPWEDRQVTVAVEIGKACDAKLYIVSPTKNMNRFCYNNAKPGELKLYLKAKVTPAKYEKDIKWTIPDIKDVTCTKTPDPPVGPKVTVVYRNLPKKNSEFGKKTIVAKLDVSGCKAMDEVDIKIFFPRDAKNNPDGKDPNWFYYWVQTAAATLGSKARYDGFKCKQEGGLGVDMLGYYPPVSLPDHYYICDLVNASGTEMKFKANMWKFKAGVGFQNNIVTTTGIDTFYLVSLHEAEHYMHLRTWWLNVDKFKRRQDDNDKDDIPDKKEKNFTKNGIRLFDPTKKQTYPGIDDEELYTELMSHEKLKAGAADKEDWAYPGKQWK
ncbi:MAG: hypothetical protein A2176_11010 [Spirochaetes bacterium RBG_13_51_14]|nr:MAG: hypothetical protein A2176_11010 [Spirochaetes bacterium RBG_13_51_14]